jgi:hypothetical protein
MAGLPAARQHRILRYCSKSRAASARSAESEFTVRADFVEKLFFSDASVCVIALIYWDVRGWTALLLKGGAHRLELC